MSCRHLGRTEPRNLLAQVQRRVRESHFVAIVTPAIKHLRKEIARLSATETPA